MNFNFTSQICTTEEQSKRLLALGLKKETADMLYMQIDGYWVCIIPQGDEEYIPYEDHLPAWSFHRLLELCNVFYLGHRDYDSLINYLENLIKEDCFNKDYLKE